MLNESSKAGLIILISVLFGIYCFVFGQSGILERMHLHSIRDAVENQIEQLEAENDALFSTYLKYKSGKYLKKEAEKSGYISPGEAVLIFPEDKGSETQSGSVMPSDANNIKNGQSETKQLRILWIILSFIIIFLYIIKNQTKTEVEEDN